jgi:hypothetical protein
VEDTCLLQIQPALPLGLRFDGELVGEPCPFPGARRKSLHRPDVRDHVDELTPNV